MLLAFVLSALLGAPEATPPPRPAPEVRAERTAFQEPPSSAATGTQAIPEPWASLAHCESTGRWAYNGPSGFDGGLQFHPRTWTAFRPEGLPAYAHQATPAQQIQVAERVLDAQGWGAWPSCSRKLGLR